MPKNTAKQGRLKVILLLQVSSHDFEPTFIIFCLKWRILPDQTSPNKNKTPNLWHITSILVCCIFEDTDLSSGKTLNFASWTKSLQCFANKIELRRLGKNECLFGVHTSQKRSIFGENNFFSQYICTIFKWQQSNWKNCMKETNWNLILSLKLEFLLHG